MKLLGMAKRDKRDRIIVFEHYDVAGWWYLDFMGTLSFGMTKANALETARELAKAFDRRILVRRTPGNAKGKTQ